MARTPNDNRPKPKPMPYGDALALVGEGDEMRTFEIGPVWTSEKGNLTLQIEMVPLAWLAPNARRRLVIKKREAL